MTEVPVEIRLPLAKGLPTDGRMRRFCHVSEQVTPPLLAVVTVNVRLFVAIEVTATAVPLATPLIFNAFAPEPPTRVIKTVGAIAFVSKINPAGALRMIVPAVTLPFWSSV